MKLALVAMSGVRACNEELLRVGLTLPGFVERSKVIASLPSLGLLTLAGLTPRDWQVSYHEIADLAAADASAVPADADVVAISSFTAQMPEAYALADRCRAAGQCVILGGLHVTSLPDEAAEHADAIVIGEAEPVWPRVLADIADGSLQPRYQAKQPFDLAMSPMPRFELLDPARYNRITVQTTRGCPHRCSFCASSILLTPGYEVKPVERVIAEIRRIKDVWSQPFIEFADDNSFINRRHARALLTALAAEGIKWFTECDISIADDDALLELMREAGCRQVLVGLESPESAGLDGVELKRNWKLRQVDRYEAAVRRIQAHGITVNGCFVLGLDGQTTDIFDRVYDFAERTNLYDVQITVATPFPGTAMYERARQDGRLLHDGDWRRYTLFDVTMEPTHMSADELQRGLLLLAERLYSGSFTHQRREAFFRSLRESPFMDRGSASRAAASVA